VRVQHRTAPGGVRVTMRDSGCRSGYAGL
jgi:hypothetical protein